MFRSPVSAFAAVLSQFLLVLVFFPLTHTSAGATANYFFESAFGDGPNGQARYQFPTALAATPDGVVYLADSANHRIRRIALDGTVSTLAGDGRVGTTDGTGSAARFSTPRGIAVGPDGMIYVSDYGNNRLRRITPAGEVTTLAADGTWGPAGSSQIAVFVGPQGIGADAAGNLYLADNRSGHRILRITPDGVISVFAGSTASGYADGQGSSARFDAPSDVAVDASGYVYVADTVNHRIRRISPSGYVDTVAGSGTGGFANGPAATAQFSFPNQIECGASGVLYVGDDDTRIRAISPDGVVSTFTGNGGTGYVNGAANVATFQTERYLASYGTGLLVTDTSNQVIRSVAADGTVGTFSGDSLRMLSPGGVVSDNTGGWWVADSSHSRIVHVSADRSISVWAGSGVAGWADGPAETAQFSRPVGLSRGPAGEIYVTDEGNHTVRKIALDRSVSTLAGGGVSGFVDGPGSQARLFSPNGIAVDAAGKVYVADSGNNRIRVITTNGIVATYAGAGTAGYLDGAAQTARFHQPLGIALGTDGTLYVADYFNNCIRYVSSEGDVGTLSGSTSSGSADGSWDTARYSLPGAVVVSPSGYLYVTQSGSSVLRRLTPAGASATVTWSQPIVLQTPGGIGITASGAIGVTSSYYGTLVQIIDPLADQSPVITTPAIDTALVTGAPYTAILATTAHPPASYALAAGSLPPGLRFDARKGTLSGTPTTTGTYTGTFTATNPVGVASQTFTITVERPIVVGVGTWVGGPTKTELAGPMGLAPLGDGGWLVADTAAHRIRRVSADGHVSEWAGDGTAGLVNGPVGQARFNAPRSLAVANDGTVFVADTNNHVIRKIAVDGTVSTFAGTGSAGLVNGAGALSRFNIPCDLSLGSDGSVYVADRNNHLIRKILADGTVSTLAGASSNGYLDGTGTQAYFNAPTGLALAAGVLYVADSGNKAIRSVTLGGVVTTVFRTSSIAALWVNDVALDPAGRVYFTSTPNVLPTSLQSGGMIVSRVVSGTSSVVEAGVSRGYQDGPGASALFNFPYGIAFDADGKLWIADYNNKALRLMREARAAPPEFTPATLVRSLKKDEFFFLRLSAGGHPAPSFVLQSGSLPPGLTLDGATGRINGTPITPGTYSGTVLASNSEGAGSLTFSLQIAATPAWSEYLASAGVPAGQSGATDDPDQDNLGNLLEYALGMNPMASDAAGAVVVEQVGGSLRLSYARIRPELQYLVETSADLGAASPWTSEGVDQGIPAENGSVTASVPVSATAVFLRLRVTAP